MNNIKKMIKGLLITIITFLILIVITTILNYYNIINHKNIVMLLVIIFSVFIGGYWIGNQAIKKGWFEGLKLSILTSSIMTIITIIFNKFTIYYLLYLTIIISSTVFGSMLGINKKNIT